MTDYKNKMKGLGKNLKKAKPATPQQVAIVKPINDMVRTTVPLEPSLHVAVKMHVAPTRTSYQDYAREAIIEKLERDGVKFEL